MDNLFEIIHESNNLSFYRYGNIVVGNGGINELKTKFPNNTLTFDSKFFPTNKTYCSTQSSQTTTVGELTIYPKGNFSIVGNGASFNISWILKN